jgi:hypothetical protein
MAQFGVFFVDMTNLVVVTRRFDPSLVRCGGCTSPGPDGLC